MVEVLTPIAGRSPALHASARHAEPPAVETTMLVVENMHCGGCMRKVEAALAALLDAGEVPEYEAVKARVKPAAPLSAPPVSVRMPDLAAYDALLSGSREASV